MHLSIQVSFQLHWKALTCMSSQKNIFSPLRWWDVLGKSRHKAKFKEKLETNFGSRAVRGGAEIISKDENMQRARAGPSRPSPRFHAGQPTFSGAGDYLPKYILGCLHNKASKCTADPSVYVCR